MDTDPAAHQDAAKAPPQPGARELLPILPIVFVVAWVVRSYELYPWVSTQAALAIAMAGATLIGLPALFWALDHGHRGCVPLVVLGTLVGVMPLVMIVSSAALGLTVRAGPERTIEMLQRGAPIPGMGTMPWITFARAEVPAAAIGAISAAIYWLVVVVATRKVGQRQFVPWTRRTRLTSRTRALIRSSRSSRSEKR
jgi:hypothetical protein